MKLLVCLLVAIVMIVGAQGQRNVSASAGNVQSFADELFENLKKQDLSAAAKCINDKSILHFSSMLPFGGRYRGPLGAATLLNRMSNFMDVTKATFDTVIADSVTGKSITNIVLAANPKPVQNVAPGQPRIPEPPRNQVREPQQPSPPAQPISNVTQGQVILTLQTVIEWCVDGSIKFISVIPLNDIQIVEQTRTRSQAGLHNLLMMVYGPREDGKAFNVEQLRQFVSDRIVLRLHNFGSSHLLAKTTFTGLQEIQQFIAHFKDTYKKTECTEVDIESMCSGTVKLLHADDFKAVYLFVHGRQDLRMFPKYLISTYTFDQQGKLIEVEIVSSRPLAPWQLIKKTAEVEQPKPKP